MKDVFELLSDARKYVIIEDGLLEALINEVTIDKMSKLEYYIESSNLQYWPQYKVKMVELILSHLTIPMNLGPHRALTHLNSQKLGVEVAS